MQVVKTDVLMTNMYRSPHLVSARVSLLKNTDVMVVNTVVSDQPITLVKSAQQPVFPF